MSWYPHSTVATVVEQNGRFLMVEEIENNNKVYNQPAGHIEENETIFEAAIRETLEETGWKVKLTAFLGLYHYRSPHNNITYLRHCFSANAIVHDSQREIDSDILAVHWFEADKILSPGFKARSPLVRQSLQDHLSGVSFPLDIIYHLRS